MAKADPTMRRTRFYISIPVSLHRQLKIAAMDKGVTLTQYAENAIQCAINADEVPDEAK